MMVSNSIKYYKTNMKNQETIKNYLHSFKGTR